MVVLVVLPINTYGVGGVLVDDKLCIATLSNYIYKVTYMMDVADKRTTECEHKVH